jgi:polysaccharide export outer membrane protein
MMARNRALFLAATLALTCGMAQAQVSPAAIRMPNTPEAASVWSENIGQEPVGAGDLIYLSVSGAPELSRSYRVSPEGKLDLPLLDGDLIVTGFTPSQIGNSITSALVRNKMLTEPIVSVAVLEYRSRQVSVVGAVKNPVIVQAVGEFKVLDAIARAQGLSPEAGPEIIVSGLKTENGTREMVHLSVKDLMSGEDESKNFLLHGGEEIRVPEAPKIYVVGNVKMPGSYPLNDLGGSTVLKALAITQGTLPFSAKSAYVYRVAVGTAERKEIPVPLRDILLRKAPDMSLMANDILYVPENAKAHLSASVLDRITGFGGNVGSSLIIWH